MTDSRPPLSDRLQALPVPEHEPDFWQRLDAELEATGRGDRRPNERPDRAIVTPRRVLLVAAILVLIAGALVVYAALPEDGEDAATVTADAPTAPEVQDAAPTADPTTPPSTVTTPSTYPGDGSREDPLLPEDVPSSPARGELVASITSFKMARAYRLYADGRLIWPQRVNPTVWVEQRLTPEGVELVRSAFISSGLFDAAEPPSDLQPCDFTYGAYGPATCVRDGDHWLRADDPDSNPPPDNQYELAPEAVALFEYLGSLDSSLPATAWADQQIKIYVPGRISACLNTYVDQTEVPADLSVLLTRFPEQAAEFLEGREPSEELTRLLAVGSSQTQGTCLDLTLEEARTLADALLSPSGGGVHEYWGIVIRFDSQAGPAEADGSLPDVAYISFGWLFPDGIPTGFPFQP